MREGHIDGFCVGEPWSSVAVATGVGTIVTTASRIAPLSPEKVLGMKRAWAEANPERVTALVRATVRSALWCEDTANHAELARLLASPRYVGVAAELLETVLSGRLRLRQATPTIAVPDFLRLARGTATFPWPGHAMWFFRQMLRWGQIEAAPGGAAAAIASYRPDLYRRAVVNLPVEVPQVDYKPDLFFDGEEREPACENSAPLSP
jgi:NitT/TauT family transport system ATP-binding protein